MKLTAESAENAEVFDNQISYNRNRIHWFLWDDGVCKIIKVKVVENPKGIA